MDLTPIREDSMLRAEVAMEDKYNLFERETGGSALVLFPPVTGVVSQPYDIRKRHFAVDVTAPMDTPIKAVANGTVIFFGMDGQYGLRHHPRT